MRTIDVEFEYPNEQELALTRVDGKPFIRDNYIFRAQYRASLKREVLTADYQFQNCNKPCLLQLISNLAYKFSDFIFMVY